jgi:Gram-negative bacterial TonB protein C-terminal
MRRLLGISSAILWLAASVVSAVGQTTSGAQVVQTWLTDSGSTPFYLQATITEPSDPNEHIEVEMSWVAPDKWKRTIRSQEFSQTLIVNGDRVSEQDSADYMPLAIQVLATAMIDPRSIVDAVRPSDHALTKANGRSDESGKMCFDPAGRMCGMSRSGLTESLSGPGRSVTFTDYRKFKGKRVARSLSYTLDHGDSYQAHVNTLGELKSDDAQFSISEITPKEKQIRSVVLPEAELRSLALESTDIIWPQVLEDNNTRGETSYYVSVDRSGQVREILPLSVSVERADDTARRQIMKWKFKPAIKDGAPVQAEAVLNFHFDTRAYGPAKPLADAETRELATNIVDPILPAGAKAGATCNIRIAVDADGKVIEQIAADGSPELTIPCMHAIGKWQFSPILEEGKPRPYRGEVTFRVP